MGCGVVEPGSRPGAFLRAERPPAPGGMGRGGRAAGDVDAVVDDVGGEYMPIMDDGSTVPMGDCGALWVREGGVPVPAPGVVVCVSDLERILCC